MLNVNIFLIGENIPRSALRGEEGKKVNVKNNFLNGNLLGALKTRLCEKESEKHACRVLA